MLRKGLDPLSAIVGTLAADQAKTLLFESRGPYAMRFDAYEHLKFGAVLSGSLSIQVASGEITEMLAGDCYLLTDGEPYRTFNDPDADEIDGTTFFNQARDEDGIVRLGEAPFDKVVIGGRLVCEPQGVAWLRGALPAIIKIPGSSPHAGGLRTTLTLLREEMGRDALGQSVVLDRLAVILLVQAIRAYIAEGGAGSSNWLAGFADARIGRALRAFHANVAGDWTVERLAREAGMSRSSFAAHFHQCVGAPPLRYIAHWRLQQVRLAMAKTDRPFAAVAADNGYRSRASCAQAFRQLYGHPPGDLRRKPENPDSIGRTNTHDGRIASLRPLATSGASSI